MRIKQIHTTTDVTVYGPPDPKMTCNKWPYPQRQNFERCDDERNRGNASRLFNPQFCPEWNIRFIQLTRTIGIWERMRWVINYARTMKFCWLGVWVPWFVAAQRLCDKEVFCIHRVILAPPSSTVLNEFLKMRSCRHPSAFLSRGWQTWVSFICGKYL